MIFCTTRGEEVGMKQKYSENPILPALRDCTFQKGKLYEGDAYLFSLVPSTELSANSQKLS